MKISIANSILPSDISLKKLTWVLFELLVTSPIATPDAISVNGTPASENQLNLQGGYIMHGIPCKMGGKGGRKKIKIVQQSQSKFQGYFFWLFQLEIFIFYTLNGVVIIM